MHAEVYNYTFYMANNKGADKTARMRRLVYAYNSQIFSRRGQYYRGQFTSHSLKHLFVCFVALRPKSTAMVIAGRSVDLTTLFPRQA